MTAYFAVPVCFHFLTFTALKTCPPRNVNNCTVCQEHSTFYGTPRLIIVFIRAHHSSCSEPNKSSLCHPILFPKIQFNIHLCLVLPSRLLFLRVFHQNFTSSHLFHACYISPFQLLICPKKYFVKSRNYEATHSIFTIFHYFLMSKYSQHKHSSIKVTG
jgi:hypothetical protein